MSVEKTIDDVKRLKKEVEDAEKELSRAEGQLEMVIKQIKDQIGLSTNDPDAISRELEALIVKTGSELGEVSNKLQALLKEVKEKYEW